ncbi:hypothetical protein B0J18DRAFT_300933 [Chaetomium sp. MPI-SDFR-AT-0129]|nr:hypothetical protein B0J18DRAFT_300933 [Chaetomium sp. MPI-SDFR-AT-0129]
MSGCSIKESLAAKNATSLMCGELPERDGSVITLYSVFIGLAVVAVLLRVVARVLTKAYFWWDDFANLFGFIGSAVFTAMNLRAIDIGQALDIWFVPERNITLVLKYFFVEMLLYTITRFFVRASIILFYMRVFPPSPGNKLGRIVQYTMIFNFVYNFSFLFAVIFQCTPISDFWTQWEGTSNGHCGNANILAWVAAATGIVFDLWLLALPFSQLWALNLHWKKKLMGGMMFFVGVAVMIISLIRLKTINEFTRAVNPTKDIVQVCLWSGIELDVGVICPCLPSFRLLLRRLLPRVMGTSKYELDPMSEGGGTRKSVAGMPAAGTRGLEAGTAVKAGDGDFASKEMGHGYTSSGGTTIGGVGNYGQHNNNNRILVENTVAIKYGSGSEISSVDARSSASVKGLVAPSRAHMMEDEGDKMGYGRRK